MADTDRHTAVVTGGAVGIGRAIATRLATDGLHVVVTDVEDGTDTADAISRSGGSAEYRGGDVTSERSMRQVFDGFDVDVLVNNAAYYAPLVGDKKRFDEIDSEEWDAVLAVNAKGVFTATKEALSHLTTGASVVNISSNTALTGVPGFLHYVASKAAVLGMTRAMANELADLDVRVNAVMPGLTASDASLRAGTDYVESVVDEQALKRPIEPEDIAAVVGFLAGPDSGMMTGQALNVDGGFTHY